MNEAFGRRCLRVLPAVLLALAVGACSGTWQGVKQDTRENVKAVGEGIEKAGETIERQAE